MWDTCTSHFGPKKIDRVGRGVREGQNMAHNVKRKETSNVIMKALYFSTDPSKLIAMADGRPFCRHHPAGQYSRPTFITSFLSSKSLLQSVHESLCSCSSRLFLSRVFNQIAFTVNLFCPSHILHDSELSLNRNLS